jgi:hypothetical protein
LKKCSRLAFLETGDSWSLVGRHARASREREDSLRLNLVFGERIADEIGVETIPVAVAGLEACARGPGLEVTTCVQAQLAGVEGALLTGASAEPGAFAKLFTSAAALVGTSGGAWRTGYIGTWLERLRT